MAKRAAIRNEGQEAETRFIRLVAQSRPSDIAKAGDAVVNVDGHDAYVEIKECHAKPGKTGTINQVRAIKYITCVIWAPEHRCWYVISADQLVGVAATKTRGQHTEIPFESMNFGLHSLPNSLHAKCNDDTLSETVHAAVRRSRRHQQIQDAMSELLREIEELKTRYIGQVQRLLRQA